MGVTQVSELGQIESPIVLTSTLNVPRMADVLLDWMLALPGNEEVRAINVMVGETNDRPSVNDSELQTEINARCYSGILAHVADATCGPRSWADGGVGSAENRLRVAPDANGFVDPSRQIGCDVGVHLFAVRVWRIVGSGDGG